MYSKSKITQSVMASALLIVFLGACVKQRPVIDSQGTAEMKPAQFDSPTYGSGKVLWKKTEAVDSYLKVSPFVIQTGNVLKKAQNTVAEISEIEPEAKIQISRTDQPSPLKYFDIVNYQTEHPLLAGKAQIVELLGQPDSTYGIVEELTPTHLVLSKVVTDDQISFVEKPYSRKEGGNWIVPIGGFAVTYLREQRLRNEDNRETNVLTRLPVPAGEYKTATHYEVNKEAFIRFERIAKTDVLPKTFFEGEWYFTETTADARFDKGSVVGDLGASDSNFLSATRVIFKVFNTQLVALNTNVDEEFKNDPSYINFNTVVKIPVEHVDYKREPFGSNLLKEQEDKELKQDDRRFLKLEYLKAETPTFQNSEMTIENLLQIIFGALTRNNVSDYKNLLDVVIGENYLSFSIRDADSGKVIRFAMKKIDSKRQMQARRAFKDDNRIFGAFTTEKAKKLDYKVARKEDMEKLILMARFNPKKDIVYHFTKKTPCEDPRSTYCVNHNPNISVDPQGQWVRNIARESINLWQQAFKKAGLKINIILDESKDVELGDIRYNVINIVPRAGAGLLGFGPSLIDSETGEIVSASMNSGLQGFQEQYYHVVRDYLARKSGYFYDFKSENSDTTMPEIFTGAPTLLKLTSDVNARLYYVDSVSGELMLNGKSTLDPDSFNDAEKLILSSIGLKPNSSIKAFATKVTDLNVHAYKHANIPSVFTFNQHAEDGFTSTMVMDAVIDANCPAVVALAKEMETKLIPTEYEISQINSCVQLLSQPDAISTVVHELGHNLSLRHNFMGSVDQKNYPKISDYELKYTTVPSELARPMTSSVMEYASREGQQVMPGPYDLAAIRWIYNEEVLTKSGDVVKVDTQKPITNTVPLSNLKPYLFCTDEQRQLLTDPLCAWHDKGVTVKETVRFSIESVYNSLSYMYRFDRRSAGSPADTLIQQGISMKAKYDKWRGFLRKHTGINKGYLQGYDAKSYADLIKSIQERGGAEAKALNDHLEVRNMIVKFLVDLAFISNKYCVVVDNEKKEKLIELEKIRKELFGAEDYSVISSCTSPSAAKYITDNKYTFVREFGHFLDAGQFDQDPSKLIIEPLDFSGTGSVRAVAMNFLTMRVTPAISNLLEGFAPSMLDEPDIREYVQFLILDRLVNGVRVAPESSRVDYSVSKLDLFGEADIKNLEMLPSYVNFDNESQLIQVFTATMANNLFMPGSPDDGRAGDVSVAIGDPSQISQIQQIAAEFVRYLNRIYYVESANSFASKILKRFKALGQQKDLIQMTPDALSGSRLKVMTELQGKALAPLKAHTTQELVNFVLEMDGRIEALMGSEETQPAGFALLTMLKPEYNLVTGLFESLKQSQMTYDQLLQMQASSDPEAKAAADQILLQPIAPIYAEMQKKDANIQPPTLAEMKRRFEALTTSHTEQYNNYARNASEYDSQIDLLQRVIQILSQ